MNRFLYLFLLFALVTNSSTGQNVFTDIGTNLGVLRQPGGEGVAVGDYNRDGFEDFFVTHPITGICQLYTNNGDGSFTESLQAAGLGIVQKANIALWADFDNDGFLDLYIANRSNPNRLFRNQQDGTFQDWTFASGIVHSGMTQAVNAADINNDGFLDLYISNFLTQNVMYLNNGDGTFLNYTTVSKAYDTGKAMGTIFFDYDNDGDQDLYLVHDGYEPNFLYQNDGSGVFVNVAPAAGVNTESFGMGVDVADVNRDGWMDLYITNLSTNFLLLNNGNGTFSNISAAAGVGDAGMGWGTVFLDYDNDGWEDIYVCNDYGFSPFRNVLYRNRGDLTFEKVELLDAVSNTEQSYGVAKIDFTQDGNIDMLVANRGNDDYLQCFENADRENAWMGVHLVGIESNHQAVGAVVTLEDNLSIIQHKTLVAGQGWASQSSHFLQFGLQDATAVEAITVRWPSGLEQVLDSLLQINQYVTIVEGRGWKNGITYDTTFLPPDTIVVVVPQDTLPQMQDLATAHVEDTTTQVSDVMPSDWFIAPNPCIENCTIHFGYGMKGFLVVYNSSGQRVLQKQILTDTPRDIMVGNLLPGLYFAHWFNEGKYEIMKLLR